MATTGAPGNIPLLDDNSVMTPIQAPFNAMATALNNALTPSGVNLAISGNYTEATPTSVQRINGMVYVSFNLVRGSSLAAAGSETLFTIGSGSRPSGQTLFGAAGWANGTPEPIAVAVNGGGVVTVFNGVRAHTNFSGSFSYVPGN